MLLGSSASSRDVLQGALDAAAEYFGASPTSVKHTQVESIGSGRHCDVYRFSFPGHIPVCLKVARGDAASTNLRKEVRFLRELRSPYFPKLLLDCSKRHFFLEELCAGVPLTNFSNLRAICAVVGRGLALALDALTESPRPIVHRDIKPKHLFLEHSRLQIIDLGSAMFEGPKRVAGAQKGRLTAKLGAGTHQFQPIEQLMEQPFQDRKVDVFAGASVIFIMLEGVGPYQNTEPRPEYAFAYYVAQERSVSRRLQGYPLQLRRALFCALRAESQRRADQLWDVAKALEAI